MSPNNKKKLNPPTNNIYIYQTKSDLSFIKKIIKKYKYIKLMDIGLKFLDVNRKNRPTNKNGNEEGW